MRISDWSSDVCSSDLMAAVDKAPGLLIGHSLGGAAALMAAREIPSIRAVATIGAPFDIEHVLHQFAPASLETIEATGEAEVLLAGRPFIVRRSFVDDLRMHDLGTSIRKLQLPLLVMHSPRDTTVGVDNAARIFDEIVRAHV